MKAFWNWLRGLFGFRSTSLDRKPLTVKLPTPKPVPAPEPTTASSASSPKPVATSTTVSSAPVQAPNPAPVVVTNVPTPALPPVVPPPVAAPQPGSVVGTPGSVPVPVVPAPVSNPIPPALPTFSDTFDAGALDTSKWIPSDWPAPGFIDLIHHGIFRPEALDFSHGCLRIKVSQTKNPDGSVTSQGGELQSRQRFGFGTYEWILRASSTSETPEGSGLTVSGQISSGFIFQESDGYTEIDSPEIEGQHPNKLSWTSWTSQFQHDTKNALTQFPNPEASFHSYKMIWQSDSVRFYVDDVRVAMLTTDIPQSPAYAMINHWGTNSQGWGGLATPGVDRYMFVKRFSFTPL